MANENTSKSNSPASTQAPSAEAKPQVKVEAAPQAKEKFFIVNQDREIPRGGGSVLLKKGKRISTHGYDIEMLKRHGVQLTEAPPSQ